MSNRRPVWMVLCFVLALVGLGFYTYSLIPGIINFPFTISWSESGRIFNAYQIYAPLLSGQHLSWPWLDPGRAILDGLVLLLPSTQIWMERFWIDLLFLLGAFVTSLVIVRKAFSFSPQRNGKSDGRLMWLLVLWGMFFLLQGPVYYHVLLGVFAIAWFYNPKKPFLTLVLVFIGSIWEGLCRVNWFIMPACVAILLYIFTETFTGKNLWRYLRWPLVYLVTGGLASFGSYLVFIKITGYVIPFLDPRMHYAYFLYKLWPNDGFVGLLPGILLICLPLLAVGLYTIWKNKTRLHWVRWLAIASLLVLFFAGSTLVSLRAGGGYDLHNYDSLLLLLFMCGCFFGLGAVSQDETVPLEKAIITNYAVMVCLLTVSILFAYHPTDPTASSKIDQSAAAIRQINVLINKYAQADHPALFIDERQLLVYQMVTAPQIYVPYDKIELMEMAMARNSGYSQKFSADIANKKFSLIISEVLPKWLKPYNKNKFDRDWYENNVWVNVVSTPVLANYTPIYTNQDLGFAIYVPK
ncbi:MAG: hypothetical protein ABSA23_10055 [Anaerolineales bacterium]|jgi:hypothetical protein